MRIDYCGMTDRGRVRQQNEDAWSADPEQSLFVVSDGIGSGSAGKNISQAVVRGLPLLIKNGVRHNAKEIDYAVLLNNSIRSLNGSIREYGNQIGLKPGSGATVVACLIRFPDAWVAHMGDSRAYLFRNAGIERKTKDHSLIRMMLEMKVINTKDTASHPLRNTIIRHVGMEGDQGPDTLVTDDLLLLCSDGLTHMVSEKAIAQALRDESSLKKKCERLIKMANDEGGRDNITVLLVRIGD